MKKLPEIVATSAFWAIVFIMLVKVLAVLLRFLGPFLIPVAPIYSVIEWFSRVFMVFPLGSLLVVFLLPFLYFLFLFKSNILESSQLWKKIWFAGSGVEKKSRLVFIVVAFYIIWFGILQPVPSENVYQIILRERFSIGLYPVAPTLSDFALALLNLPSRDESSFITAQTNRQPQQCAQITYDLRLQEECLNMLSDLATTPALCEQYASYFSPALDISKGLYLQACYVKTAGAGYTMACSRFSTGWERGECYKQQAKTTGDSSVCKNIPINKIGPDQQRYYCYGSVVGQTGDAKICANIPKSFERDNCYQIAAQKTGDTSLCNNIDETKFLNGNYVSRSDCLDRKYYFKL